MRAIVVGVACWLVLGCGGDDGDPPADRDLCVGNCEDAASAGCGGSDCTSCDTEAGLSARAGCTAENTAFHQCLADATDICNAGCGALASDWAACIAPYCQATPSDTDCPAPPGG